ncbi:MAG: DUF99 family protein [Exilibacterium sp.]
MQTLENAIKRKKHIRAIGFDDAPFEPDPGSPVNIAGVVCSNTRFEGMLWGCVQKDGNEATEALTRLLKSSKFYEQVHVVLTDGVAVGGFNIIDLPRLSTNLNRPCIAVMRRNPDMDAIDKALKNFADYATRKQTLLKAGEVYSRGKYCFQVNGCDPTTAAQTIELLTENGYIPEALRLAHLIGGAVITGQSGNRA